MSQTLDQIRNFKGTYPKQIWGLFFSEMWERFCFYAMRGMLTYFMVYHLFMDEKVAQLQYGATQAFVYAFTFIGGLLADKILGFRRSLLWGATLMIIGSLLLALNPHQYFFLGIAFNIVGTGFSNPTSRLWLASFIMKEIHGATPVSFFFYSGINLGGFFGGFVISIGKGTLFAEQIPESLRWNVAFGLAAVVMLISLINFIFTKNKLATIGLPPKTENPKKNKINTYLVYAGTLLMIPLIILMVSNTKYTDYFMYCIGPFSLIYLLFEMTKNTASENKKLIAALFFIIFSVFFWAIFEQAGGSLSLFAAKHLQDRLLGFSIDPNAVNNSINSLFVIIFAPIVGLFFIWLAKRRLEPNSIIKFGLSFLLLGLSFYVFYSVSFSSNALGKGSLNVFALGYFIVSFAELFLSPIGLSLMTKLSPYRLQGFMMGMWFLASAYGQYVAGLFGASISPEKNAGSLQKMLIYTQGYKEFAIYAIVAGVVLILISPVIKKLMQGVK